MSRFVLLALTALSLAFAPAPLPRPDSNRDDLKRMQGTWVVVSRTAEGRAIQHCVDNVVVRDKQFTLNDATGQFRSTWAMVLDGTKRPRHFDMKWVEGIGGGGPGVGPFTSTGIYVLEGDTLRLCYVNDKNTRPTHFTDSERGVVLEVLQRRKP